MDSPVHHADHKSTISKSGVGRDLGWVACYLQVQSASPRRTAGMVVSESSGSLAPLKGGIAGSGLRSISFTDGVWPVSLACFFRCSCSPGVAQFYEHHCLGFAAVFIVACCCHG